MCGVCANGGGAQEGEPALHMFNCMRVVNLSGGVKIKQTRAYGPHAESTKHCSLMEFITTIMVITRRARLQTRVALCVYFQRWHKFSSSGVEHDSFESTKNPWI